MRKITTRVVATTLATMLVAMPLTGCSGCSLGRGDADGDATDADTPAVADTYDGVRGLTGDTDSTAWTKLADAYAGTTFTSATVYDDAHYLVILENDGNVIRVVAKMTPEVMDALGNLDYSLSQRELDQHIMDLTSELEIERAEDLTPERLTDEQIDGLVGRLGSDLAADGFVFEAYASYGGEQTGVTLAKGSFSYLVMFDCQTGAEAPDDNGATILPATVTSATCIGMANSATDLDVVIGTASVTEAEIAPDGTVAEGTDGMTNGTVGGEVPADTQQA